MAGATLLLTAAFCATQASSQALPDRASMMMHTTPGKLVTMAEWTERMHHVLEHELRYPVAFGEERIGTGTVRVKFNCSDSGRPDKVSLLKTSGDKALDRAALTAVRRMASLHPLPTGFKRDQKFEAVVIFATDRFDPRLRAADAERTSRNAWYHDPEMAGMAMAVDADGQLASIH